MTSNIASLPPPPASDFGVVPVDALAAALLKLGITDVTATRLLEAVKQEGKREDNGNASTERHKAILKLASEPEKTQYGSIPPYKSVFIEHPKPPVSSDPKTQERRRRLRALAKAAFPDGKVPDPYTNVWLNEFGDDAAKRLPFILSSLVMTPLDDDSTQPPEQRFDNVWCLWDTGAQISQVLSSQLDPRIRGDQTSGQALMSIKFSGLEYTFESIIAFREHMPNNTTFIILGQHALLNRLQYIIQPQLLNPQLKTINPADYGQIDLLYYADPLNDDNPDAAPVVL